MCSSKATVFILLAALLSLPAVVAAQDGDALQDIEGQRLAQTGMKFLSLPVDARTAALGNAVIAEEGSSVSLFYNPASMVGMEDQAVHVGLGSFEWIGGIQYNAGSVAFQPANGQYGIFGISVQSVDYGKVEEVIRADNRQGYRVLGTIQPSALAVGLGYARQVTDRFSVGGQAKYARQSFGATVMRLDDAGSPVRSENQKGTVAFDLGVLYHTGFESLTFAMSARNFSQEITYAEESFELPLMLRVGLAMDVVDLTNLNPDMHSVQVSVEGHRPRDYFEQVRTGVEYEFMNTISVRGGYILPHDERGLNLGTGVQFEIGDLSVGADYAFSEFGIFGSVNRISVDVGI